MKIDLVCQHCHQTFTVEYRARRQKYCSVDCYLSSYTPVPQIDASDALAYLLGVRFGDGHASEYQFIVQVADKPFAHSCIAALRAIGLRPTVREIHDLRGRSRMMFRVVAASRQFALWLRAFHLEGLADFLTTPDHRRAFLRGVYESEGHVHVSTGVFVTESNTREQAGYGKTYSGVGLTITSTNHALLVLMQQWAAERGHTLRLRWSRKTVTGKDAFELAMSDIRGVRAFLEDLNPCVKRLDAYPEQTRYRLLTLHGETLSLSEWARKTGFSKDKISKRLKRGWSLERSLTTP